MANPRKFHTSSNDDQWFLGVIEETGHPFIEHRANQSAGGAVDRTEVAAFLADGTMRPEQDALLKLIGTLAVL